MTLYRSQSTHRMDFVFAYVITSVSDICSPQMTMSLVRQSCQKGDW